MFYGSYIRHIETLISLNRVSVWNLIYKEDGAALSDLFENFEQVTI
jgi:hypothetical protein